MTVSSEVARAGPYAANGSTTVFPFSFKAYAASDLSVIITDEDGIDATLGTDEFSVTGLGTASGSVTLDEAPASGRTVTIIREVPLLQETNLRNQGTLYQEAIERRFDYVVMGLQRLNEKLERTIRLPRSEDPDDFPVEFSLAAARAGKVLGFDADGLLTYLTPTSDIADLTSSLVMPTGGDNPLTLAALLGRVFDVRTFGAVADYAGNEATATDNSEAFIAAVQAAIDAGGGKVLFPRSGTCTYMVGSSIAFPSSAVDNPAVTTATPDVDLEIELEAGVVIRAASTLEDPMFSLVAPAPTGDVYEDLSIYFHGGRLDVSAQANSPGGEAWDCLQVSNWKVVRVWDTWFYHGVDYTETVGGDSGIVTTSCWDVVIDRCRFVAAYDLGIYINRGADVRVSNCFFYGCANGVAAKRISERYKIQNNTFVDCVNAISSGPATVGPPTLALIQGNDVIRPSTWGINIEGANNCMVTGNRVVDAGQHLSGSVNTAAVGIYVQGCQKSLIGGNMVAYVDTTSVASHNGILMVRWGDGVDFFASEKNLVIGNVITNCYRGWQEKDSQVDENYWINNLVYGASTANLIVGASSIVHEPRAYVSSLQVITAGGTLSLTHGLPVRPRTVALSIVCSSTNNGWSANDEVEIPVGIGSDSRGVAVMKGDTQLTIRFGNDANPINVGVKGTGAAGAIDPTKWSLRVRAFT